MKVSLLVLAGCAVLAPGLWLMGLPDSHEAGDGAGNHSIPRKQPVRAPTPQSEPSAMLELMEQCRSPTQPGTGFVGPSADSGLLPDMPFDAAMSGKRLPQTRFNSVRARSRLPLVFALDPTEAISLGPERAAQAASVAEEFFQSIGGEKADPASPDYGDRWKREQSAADYRLRAAIGGQAFARYQEEVYMRSKAAAPGSKP